MAQDDHRPLLDGQAQQRRPQLASHLDAGLETLPVAPVDRAPAELAPLELPPPMPPLHEVHQRTAQVRGQVIDVARPPLRPHAGEGFGHEILGHTPIAA